MSSDHTSATVYGCLFNTHAGCSVLVTVSVVVIIVTASAVVVVTIIVVPVATFVAFALFSALCFLVRWRRQTHAASFLLP